MVSSELIEIILKAQDQASSTAEKVEGQMEKIGESANNANQKATSSQNSYQQALAQTNSKLSESSSKFNEIGSTGGSAFQKVSSKVVEVGNKIKNDIGNKWDTIKGKVTGFGSHIKSSLSGALSTVRSKIESLGNAFSGLGGVMSTVFGGIGLKAMGDMTIGASINRDRIFNLSYAVLGAGKSMEYFKKNNDSLWNQMDSYTNKSLVGLDQISQAMSVINMSANATEGQLKELMPVVGDIGQRAILMGKSGEEAVGLMEAAGKGLNGEFEMLRENLGITKDKLIDAGWSGAADDIDGYTAALKKCLSESGDVSNMMDTTSGKLTILKKYWGLAGRSIGDDFLPYLDGALTGLVKFLDADKDGALDDRGKQWLQYGYGVMAAGSAFATAAPQINNVISCFDNVLSILKSAGGAIRSVGSAFGIMSTAEDLAAASAEANALAQGSAAVASETSGVAAGASAAGHAAAATAEEAEAVAAETAALSTWSLVWPVLAVIAAFAAIAVVIYEVGKAFGWWTDVGTMIEAITSGVQRMWDAFINNPDVQDLLKGISDGFSWIVAQIGPAIQGMLKFLGISTNGDFDIVHVVIELAGEAFHLLADAVRAVLPYLQSFFNECIVPLATFVGGVLYVAFQGLVELFGVIAEQVGNVISVFQQFQDGQASLMDVVVAVGTAIGTVWWTIVTQVGTLVLNLVANLLTWAIQAGLNVLTGIATYLSQVPMRVATFLAQVLSQIISYGARWVAMARVKANLLLLGVVSYLRQLPGRALSALLGVVSSIVNAGAQWVSNARSKASEVVSSVTNTLTGLPGKISGALGGVVDAITKPFKDAYDTLTGIVDKIKSKASEVANISLPTGWGGETAYGGETALPTFSSDGGTVIRHESEPIEVNVNENITLDLVNVPGHIDTNTLITMLSDREVLRSLTGNKDFQSLDAKVKEQLNFKVNRSRGI